MNRINLICLGVRSMERSLDFYKGIGFRTYEQDACPPVVFFDNQGSKLELYPLEELARDIDDRDPPALSPGGFGGVTLACNCRSPQEVDAVMALAAAQGGVIAKTPRTVFWGGYSGYFQDPDGYYWEVAYGPNWVYDDNGMLVID